MTKDQPPRRPQFNTDPGNCLRGCGDLVGKTGRSLCKPGHDAWHSVRPLRCRNRDESRIGVLPTPALRPRPNLTPAEGHNGPMCGRYVVSKSTADLIAAFDVHESYVDELVPSYNVAPTDTV